ncbi:MAG TPA: endonuclease/exonuclease/phosphatase family protein [Polyangiales bacterium]|nr:endonuclease/exonuclease/phosphatase family protein [Polyangiales bacterium]
MTLAVTTWNVESFATSSESYGAKLDHLTTVLRSLQPDVLALQDVRDEQSVDELALKLDFAAAVVGMPDDRGSRVAVLLRREPLEVHYLDKGFSRTPLRVVIEHAGQRLHIVTAHLDSKLATVLGGRDLAESEHERTRTLARALERRVQEVVALREHITELLAAEEPALLLADLNDVPEAATTQLLYGPPGCQPRGPSDRTNAQGTFQRGDRHDAQRLFNVALLAPESDRWSRMAHGQRELLDHILASAALMPREHGLRRTPAIEIRNGFTGEPDLAVPDHAPVSAKFVI